MGVKLESLALMLPVLEVTRKKAGARLLLLGTQDFYFTYQAAVSFLRRNNVRFVDVPESERRCTDSFAYVAHPDWWKYRHFIHQATFFRLLGFGPDQVDTMDVSTYENANIIHDLNQPIPAHLHGYDLIFDLGTLEHVFDIRQALWNLCELAAIGGRVLHGMPANLLDHGFFNFNATLLADFYRQAGWVQEDLFYVAGPTADIGDKAMYVRIEPGALSIPPGDFYLGLWGHFRKAEGTSTPIPVQGLYEDLHDAWTRQSRTKSQHEAPAARPGDWAYRALSRLRRVVAFHRARWAARSLCGKVVTFSGSSD
jgi:hypothetical protein